MKCDMAVQTADAMKTIVLGIICLQCECSHNGTKPLFSNQNQITLTYGPKSQTITFIRHTGSLYSIGSCREKWCATTVIFIVK